MVGVDCEALASALWTMAAGVTVCCASFKDNESLPSLEPLSPLQAGSDGQTRCWGGSALIFFIFLFVFVLVAFLHMSFQEVFFAYFPLPIYGFLLVFFGGWFVIFRGVLGLDHSLTFLPSR